MHEEAEENVKTLAICEADSFFYVGAAPFTCAIRESSRSRVLRLGERG